MKDFTDNRIEETPDELWITEHPPVFTQGLNGRAEHLLNPADIPVVQIDRGGQVTYHGPGQLVLYCLLDLPRRGLGVKGLVSKIETSVIELLKGYGIEAATRPGAPGVYVDQAKIAALGLRIRKGCCYHGLSLERGYESGTVYPNQPLRLPRSCEVTRNCAISISTMMLNRPGTSWPGS